MARMFVAVVPPEAAVEDLDEFLSVRRDAAPRPGERWRWAPPEQWHLTLAFMEDVPDRAIDDLVDRLAATAGRQQAFPTRVAGGGAFPHPDAARVLWAGLEGDFDAQRALAGRSWTNNRDDGSHSIRKTATTQMRTSSTSPPTI